MTTWVLILALHWGYGTTSQTIEFSSKEACVEAGKKVQAQWNSAFSISSSFICIQK